MLEAQPSKAESPRPCVQENRTNMSMLGKVDDLVALVNPGSRLWRGLDLLRNCLTGRRPEVVSQLASLEPGETRRVTVDGDVLYLLIQCYRTRRRLEGRFEAHLRHADLQFLWSGRECIEVFDVRTLQPLPARDEHGNVHFPMGDELHSRLLLQAGAVAVLLPQDAHAPCLALEDEGETLVRKIVVKVRDAHRIDSPVPEDSPEAAIVPTASPVAND